MLEANESLENIFENAVKEAEKRKHEYVTIEHVLLALVKDEAIGTVLHDFKIQVGALIKDIEDYLDTKCNDIITKSKLRAKNIYQEAREKALKEINLKKETLDKQIDEEIKKDQNELISERHYQKLLNQFEAQFVNSNSSVEGIANSLAKYYLLHNDVNLINKYIDYYRSIDREEIREVARKYLSTNQRVEIEYLVGSAN